MTDTASRPTEASRRAPAARTGSTTRLLAPVEPHRAALEFGALVMASPLLVATHRADGHPVLVVPGLSGGIGWSLVLRNSLRAIGHPVYGPRFATTKAPADRVVARLGERVDELAQRHGAPVSVIGWSIGGCHARRVAAEHPDLVRRVVTLGPPLGRRVLAHPAGGAPLATAQRPGDRDLLPQ